MYIEDINKRYKNLGKSKVRLLTFQSKEVLDILLKNRYYECDIGKSREERSYREDIKQLEGENPIWCFSPTSFREGEQLRFSKDQFVDGSLFFDYKCEMSLPSGESFNSMYLLELEICAEDIRVGLTHNAYSKAVVIKGIERKNLIAVYRLDYNDKDSKKWFYPIVEVEKIFGDNPLFNKRFICVKPEKPIIRGIRL